MWTSKKNIFLAVIAVIGIVIIVWLSGKEPTKVSTHDTMEFQVHLKNHDQAPEEVLQEGMDFAGPTGTPIMKGPSGPPSN